MLIYSYDDYFIRFDCNCLKSASYTNNFYFFIAHNILTVQHRIADIENILCQVCYTLILSKDEFYLLYNIWRLGGEKAVKERLNQLGFENK